MRNSQKDWDEYEEEYDEYDDASREYYSDKLGLTAKEYVKGTFDPAKNEYYLTGYKKDDPNLIIGIDTYRLKVDEYENIGGTTKANGSWKGRINSGPTGLL